MVRGPSILSQPLFSFHMALHALDSFVCNDHLFAFSCIIFLTPALRCLSCIRLFLAALWPHGSENILVAVLNAGEPFSALTVGLGPYIKLILPAVCEIKIIVTLKPLSLPSLQKASLVSLGEHACDILTRFHIVFWVRQKAIRSIPLMIRLYKQSRVTRCVVVMTSTPGSPRITIIHP